MSLRDIVSGEKKLFEDDPITAAGVKLAKNVNAAVTDFPNKVDEAVGRYTGLASSPSFWFGLAKTAYRSLFGSSGVMNYLSDLSGSLEDAKKVLKGEVKYKTVSHDELKKLAAPEYKDNEIFEVTTPDGQIYIRDDITDQGKIDYLVLHAMREIKHWGERGSSHTEDAHVVVDSEAHLSLKSLAQNLKGWASERALSAYRAAMDFNEKGRALGDELAEKVYQVTKEAEV